MIVKVSEATAKQLDWLVAKLEGYNPTWFEPKGDFCFAPHVYLTFLSEYKPSIHWAQGGPIIEREKIKVAPNLGGSWHGQIRHTKTYPLAAYPVLAGWTNQHGSTPLIAAMRCYIVSMLGNKVEVSDDWL